MKQIFVDANVVIDILLQRAHYQQSMDAIKDPDANYFISVLTVHLTYHFGQKDKFTPGRIKEVVDLFGLLDIEARMVKQAQKRYSGKGFEDCLQAACAEGGDCDEILTIDTDFAKLSGTKLPVKVIR